MGPDRSATPRRPGGNPFKDALARGHAQIGLWLSMADACSSEICGSAGFQWLLIDNGYAPNDVRSALSQLQALAGYPSHPVVRTVGADNELIRQLLDIGAQTLLVPMVDTPEQAASVVAATRYPPHGVRGGGCTLTRASRWNARADHARHAHSEVCLLVQAETTTAIANLNAICDLDGIDGVFIGPAGLAASLGHLGNPAHPDVQATIDAAIRTIVASGKAAGTLTSDPAQARHYLGIGATFVAVGIDVSLLAQATRQVAGEFGLGPV